jgi:uncharacterized protein YidB (DUF937 family)
MGLLDVVNGMLNGPRGQRQPQPEAKGGMSPITMAILGLLAYKAVKGSGVLGGAQPAAPGGADRPPPVPPGRMASAGTPGGGLADILGGLLGGAPAKPGSSLNDLIPGGLGGLLGGAAAGTVLSGGLGTLIKDLQNAGLGQAAQSWVATGPNQQIAPNDLAAAIGADTIDALTKQTGMTRDELLAGLSQHLPGIVDQLTPQGRLPTEKEAAQQLESAPT